MFYGWGLGGHTNCFMMKQLMSGSSPMLTDEQKTQAVALLALTVSVILLVA